MNSYRPIVTAISIAFVAIISFLLPAVGLLSLGEHLLLAAIPLTLLLIAVFYVLLLRRGRHAWNVDSLEITIKYEDVQGEQVTIRRDQTIYPNRSGVRAARIRLSHGADPDKLDQENWTPQGVHGRAFGRRPPVCNPDRDFFRQAAGHWLYIIPPDDNGEFPYPGLLSLFRPRHYPHNYYRIEIVGSTSYRDCFTADDEYYQLNLGDATDAPWIRAISFTLILPDQWAEKPSVNLYRMSATRLDRIAVASQKDPDNPGFTRFTANTQDCSHETLRLDWRKLRPTQSSNSP